MYAVSSAVCCGGVYAVSLYMKRQGQMLILSTCSKVFFFSDASILLEVRLGNNENYVEMETHFSVCWLAY